MSDVRISPVDAWFFRDGRPYVEGESNQSDVESTFPPNPRTVVGALRAAAARGLGWNGRSSWSNSQAIVDALGDGPDETGVARFDGVFLRKEKTAWFPAPQHLLLEREVPHHPAALAGPGKAVHTDIGEVRLVELRPQTRDCENCWVTLDGLEKILRGVVPEKVASNSDFFELEPRIGIRIDHESGTTGDGAMYSPHYVRLARSVEVVARTRDLSVPAGLVPFGGEARMAELAPMEQSTTIAAPLDAIRKDRQFIAAFLSPADLGHSSRESVSFPGPGDEVPGLPGARIVSAALSRPVALGGWDSIERRPLPLRPHLAPGSVYFCEVDDSADIDAVLAAHDTCIGQHANLGFGHVVLGVWPASSGE